ncbi:MAG: type II toxin-antitoxin system RelE/ParE family toxin [Opitutales bacterium]|nr:type II toxin-antitoxin system RelE/ParE family toxin [Opitutales bacterium]
MKRNERIEVYFYRTSAGREPVREFLQTLSDEEKKIIGTDIKVVQWRWPTGEPLVKNLGNSVYEIRSTLKNRIARVLFSQIGDKLVLLHSFIKKTQKTDDKDIKMAIKRLKEVLNEKK